MQTTFYNVGHGEAIFIELDNGRGIVRDFGRSKYGRWTKHSCTPSNLLRGGCITKPFPAARKVTQLDAVLSHAHEDHFNGFKLLYDRGKQDLFQNGYVPWFRMSDLGDLGGVLIKYSLLLYGYQRKQGVIKSNARNWVLAAPIMASICEKLWCVSAGYQVPHWKLPNRMLWPPVPSADYAERLKDKFDDFLLQNDLPTDFLDEDAEDIRGKLEVFYPDGEGDVIGQIHNEETIQHAIQHISRVMNRQPGRSEFQKMKTPRSVYASAYKATLDNHSLMFEIGSGRNEALFLSDANDPTVGKMLELNNLQMKRYNLIKSSHHGNRGAKKLAKKQITGNRVVNCCGPAHANWKGPCTEYLQVSSNVICTDWNDRSNAKWTNKGQYQHGNACCITI